MENDTNANALSLLGDLKHDWGWLLATGILFIILGLIALSMVIGVTMLSMMFLGILLLIGGIAQCIELIKVRAWKGTVWHALIAMLYLFGGVSVIYNPVLASTVMTAIIAGVIIAAGVSRIIMALMVKSTEGWGWLLLSGIISLILGFIILAHWPVSGLWVIGTFIAVELIMHGWTYIVVALAARKAS